MNKCSKTLLWLTVYQKGVKFIINNLFLKFINAQVRPFNLFDKSTQYKHSEILNASSVEGTLNATCFGLSTSSLEIM